MDREKIVKGLECHRIDNNHRINCADCPYYVEDDNHIRCVNDLHDDTIVLLKEQEAVEPVTESSVYDPDTWFFVCGSCKKGVISPGDNFCRWCGQAVKWE